MHVTRWSEHFQGGVNVFHTISDVYFCDLNCLFLANFNWEYSADATPMLLTFVQEICDGMDVNLKWDCWWSDAVGDGREGREVS
jgi:hypothetical protein